MAKTYFRELINDFQETGKKAHKNTYYSKKNTDILRSILIISQQKTNW